jgi:hypothetical protein
MQSHLTANGVETLVHYPVPIPQQPAMATGGRLTARCEPRLCGSLLASALPRLPDAAISEVTTALASGPAAAVSRDERNAQR